MKHLRTTAGYTLVEVIVVMAIFMAIIIVTADSFNTVTTHAGQQSKSAETQIAGIVGLELLRADLQQAGFGLPWDFSSNPNYQEADDGAFVNSFNDAPSNAPRAVASAQSTFNQDASGASDYLVIKSTVVGSTPTAKKWTTVAFSGGTRARNPVRDAAFGADERVIVVKNSLASTPPKQLLMVDSSTGSYFRPFGTYSTIISRHQDGDSFEVYGVHPTADPKAPFNRADYYVKTPASGMPQDCAPHTGILYKSVLDHATRRLSAGTALLDCVADMQVEYGLDTSGAGFVNDHVDAPPTDAADVRRQVREIRVYILAHEGKRDRSYTYPSETIKVGEDFGGTHGRLFNLNDRIGGEYKHYRWKVYTIVARPKNLIQ
ncbi:PilW family protein [Geomonas sp. RF6]|uniref:PilW family protein n=1 Tax=Geomonas sp. RF6 TaxID=2897342 RepID=UPI001E54DBA7|nr:PilW family protein [Geomonas sp. RF6]UFS69641.1 PilW family protein [Geomonas sp. RF6]